MHKLMRYLFVYRGMQDVISRASPTNRVRLDHLPARVEPDRYRRQLEGVAARAREHGIDLVFLMFGDNPTYTYTYDLDRGMALHASGHLDEAIRNLEIAVSRNNAFSDVARLQLAEAYKQAGRADDVEAVLTLTHSINWLHGGRAVYVDRHYHDIMRAVARSLDLHLIDATEILDRDPSQYVDGVHFDSRGHNAVAGVLKDMIADWLEKR